MRKCNLATVFTCLLAATSTAAAQDNTCSVLLRHGIYDTYRQQSGAVNATQFHTNLCEAYSRYKQDQSSGSVRVSYAVFGAGGDYSASQLDVIGRTMCSTSESSAFSQSDLSVFSSTINPQAVVAFSECMRQFGYGLRTQTDIRESDAGHLTLTINYVPMPGAPGSVPLRYVRVDPQDAWSCGGTLWDKRNGDINLDTTVYSLSCERNFRSTTVDGRAFKAGPSTVTVATGNATVTRNFSAEPAAPPPVPGAFPVGAIVSFWGTKAEAEQQKAFGWWPCDGSKIADQLSPLFDKDAPNLDKVFLRGSTSQAGVSGGSDTYLLKEQKLDGFYNGWSQVGAPGAPEMWVLSGGMGWKSGALQKVQVTVPEATVTVTPSYRSVIYLIRTR
jgi:hypothetical protein